MKNHPLPVFSLTHRLVTRIAIFLFIATSGIHSARAQSGAVPCPANLDFSFSNFNNWSCYTGDNLTNCGFRPCMNNVMLTGPLAGRHIITSGAGTDPVGGFPVVCPGGGLTSVRVGQPYQAGNTGDQIIYHVHIPTGFNNYSFDYRYAFVLNNGYHGLGDQASFEVVGRDSATGNIIPCATHTYTVDAANNPGLQDYGSGYFGLPWTNGNLNLSGYGGRTVNIEVTAYDCTGGAHEAWGYFDVVSCGRFVGTVTYCDLKNNILQLAGPGGYQTYKWYTATWTYVGTGQILNVAVPTTPTYYYCVLVPFNGAVGGCYDTIRTRNVANFTLNTTPKNVCNTLGKPIGIRTTVTGGTGGFTFSWLAGPNLTTYNPGIVYPKDSATARPTGAETYFVTVTDSVGCFRRDTITVVNPSFSVNLGPDLTTCLGTSINLNPTYSPPSSGYIYSWSAGTHLSDSTISNPVYIPGAVGTETLMLRIDSSICAAGDTINIRTLPNSFTVSDTAVCEGAKFTANVVGDTTAFHYVWSPIDPFITVNNATNGSSQRPLIQGDSTRTYTVKARYPTCPDIVRTLTVRVEPVPKVELGADTVDKCFYQPLYLTANVLPAWFTKYSYQWRANEFIDNPLSSLITFTGKSDTTLRVTVSTPLGCRGRDSVRVRVYQGGFGIVSPRDTAICPGGNFSLHASGGVKYSWSPSLYLSDSSGTTVMATPGTTMNYKVYVTDKNGCIDTVPVKLHVYAEANVSLPDSTVLYPGERYQMNPSGNALYYSWFPTVGLSDPYASNPVASPEVNTLYRVTATTEAGCVATDSMRVIVKEDAVLAMPNAFSPGSAPNALFSVAHSGLATLKYFRVYNRWGVKMFETSNLDAGWDGRYNGEPQPMGVYIYTVEGTTTKGIAFQKQGNVTLIR